LIDPDLILPTPSAPVELACNVRNVSGVEQSSLRVGVERGEAGRRSNGRGEMERETGDTSAKVTSVIPPIASCLLYSWLLR
jgi:hypothetical protein